MEGGLRPFPVPSFCALCSVSIPFLLQSSLFLPCIPPPAQGQRLILIGNLLFTHAPHGQEDLPGTVWCHSLPAPSQLPGSIHAAELF